MRGTVKIAIALAIFPTKYKVRDYTHFIAKFPDTLSDTLSPVPMKTADGHMHIYVHVDKDAVPHQEVVTRQMLLRYKLQMDVVVDDLINKNLITMVQKATK